MAGIVPAVHGQCAHGEAASVRVKELAKTPTFAQTAPGCCSRKPSQVDSGLVGR